MPIPTPFVTPFVGIRDFGAVPNDPRPPVRRANSKAFEKAQDAMLSDPQAWGHPIFVPSGAFYLADDLHIYKSIHLFGTGVLGESILMFPEIFKITDEALACLTAAGAPTAIVEKLKAYRDKEFLDQAELMEASVDLLGEADALANRDHILSCCFRRGTSLILDPSTNLHPELTGSDSMIRDLQIISEENWEYGPEDSLFDPSKFDPPALEGKSKGTPGIQMHVTATVQRVLIEHFAGTGITIFAGGESDANYWRLHDVYISTCGGHGVHVDGGETQGGLCTGVKMIAIGGSGIINSPFGGNTYVGCYVFTAKGRGYMSEGPGISTFVGCYSEANEAIHLPGGATAWIGGSFGEKGFTSDSTGFIAESYGNVHPFVVPNQLDLRIHKEHPVQLYVGYPNDESDPTSILAWENFDSAGFYLMRWDNGSKAWTVENGSMEPTKDPATGELKLDNRSIAYYLTGSGHARDPWRIGFGEMFLGPVDHPIKISHGILPDGAKPGDIVYSAEPKAGDFIGQVCVSSGPPPEWKPFGRIEA